MWRRMKTIVPWTLPLIRMIPHCTMCVICGACRVCIIDIIKFPGGDYRTGTHDTKHLKYLQCKKEENHLVMTLLPITLDCLH